MAIYSSQAYELEGEGEEKEEKKRECERDRQGSPFVSDVECQYHSNNTGVTQRESNGLDHRPGRKPYSPLRQQTGILKSSWKTLM